MEIIFVYLAISFASLVNAFPYDPDTSARISPYVPDVYVARTTGRRQEQMIGSMEANELLQILGLNDGAIPSTAEDSLSDSTSDKNRFAYPFMVNLYNSVADPMSGLTFGRRPYNATKIRAVPEGGRGGRLGFHFNLSLVESSASLLQAEFHLYRLGLAGAASGGAQDTRRPNYFQVHIYQLMSSDLSSLDGARLVGLRLMSSKGTGWEVFNIRHTVQEWLTNKTSNFGLYITVTSLSGQRLPDNMLRFAKRARHDNSRQPILVLFTQESMGRRNVSHDGQRIVDETSHSAISTMVFHHEPSSGEPQRRKRSLAKHRAYLGGSDQSEEPTRSAGCMRKNMYVSLDAIGWSPWIIAPKGYDAYRCNGGCPLKSRSEDEYSWSNHAKVQAIMNRRKRGVAPPCCVHRYSPSDSRLSMWNLKQETFVLTELPDMIVAKCGCR
uniref:Tgf-beta bone morphogenetic protein 0 n=1 Tax=Paracentrotus lividus TaxID=7656 RepID=A0A0N9SLA8_PARLI|nr:Tgf-beta bone morphogenetic protein 0 [Paracentrotus lividus]